MIVVVVLLAGFLVSSYALLHRRVTRREQRDWTIPTEWFVGGTDEYDFQEWEDLGGEG